MPKNNVGIWQINKMQKNLCQINKMPKNTVGIWLVDKMPKKVCRIIKMPKKTCLSEKYRKDVKIKYQKCRKNAEKQKCRKSKMPKNAENSGLTITVKKS
jgi:hypothetical protein